MTDKVKRLEKRLQRILVDEDVVFDFNLDKEKQRTDSVWDIAPVKINAKERTKYPTQEPLALLERIIQASSTRRHRPRRFLWLRHDMCSRRITRKAMDRHRHI